MLLLAIAISFENISFSSTNCIMVNKCNDILVGRNRAATAVRLVINAPIYRLWLYGVINIVDITTCFEYNNK